MGGTFFLCDNQMTRRWRNEPWFWHNKQSGLRAGMCVICVARVCARSCHTNVAYPPFRSPPLRSARPMSGRGQVSTFSHPGSLGGSQRARYQKTERGCNWMFPGTKKTERRYIRMFPTAPRTGTRAHSPKPPFYETALLFPLEFWPISITKGVFSSFHWRNL